MANTAKSEIVGLLHLINEGATSSHTPLGEVMRLCLRLGRLLDNKELGDWAKAEAKGYDSKDSLPDYRIFDTAVKGFFGAQVAVALKILYPSLLSRKSTGTYCSKLI